MQTEEGKFAVCHKCGTYSADYDICEGCKRTLPDDVKYYMPDKIKKPRTDVGTTAQQVICLALV